MSTPSFIKELSIPAIAAPMFLISGPKLVIECCKNGIVGTFPALNQRTSEGFEEWLIEIKTALSDFEKETGTKPAPFGVNLIVHQSNPRVQADLMLCVKHQVPIIITSLGAVPQLVDHGLSESEYNDRREVCEKVSGLLHLDALRDASKEDIDRIKNDISDGDYQKALYVINENHRVKQFSEAI